MDGSREALSKAIWLVTGRATWHLGLAVSSGTLAVGFGGDIITGHRVSGLRLSSVMPWELL